MMEAARRQENVMKLDRNINVDGMGKYALLKLRRLNEVVAGRGTLVAHAIEVLEKAGILDWGKADTEAEFFVIRLKDKYAQEALEAYANEAGKDDSEYADEIRALADRAGPNSPFCKVPD